MALVYFLVECANEDDFFYYFYEFRRIFVYAVITYFLHYEDVDVIILSTDVSRVMLSFCEVLFEKRI